MRRITTSNHSPSKLLTTKLRSVLWIALFGAIGVGTLLISKAASPFVGIEPEVGAKSGLVSSVADPLASGGSVVACGLADTIQAGVWKNVTPSNMDLRNGTCYNLGVNSMAVDPNRPSNLYTQLNCHDCFWAGTKHKDA